MLLSAHFSASKAAKALLRGGGGMAADNLSGVHLVLIHKEWPSLKAIIV